MKNSLIHQLWEAAPPPRGQFDPASLGVLLEPAQRYLSRAIAPGTPLYRAARLTMKGEIRLKGWVPFDAEQVIAWDRGFVWAAKTRMMSLPVSGFDRSIEGRGEMDWRLLGLLPVMRASGPDIDRSAAGRMAAEAVWLPTVLLSADVQWGSPGADTAEVHLEKAGTSTALNLTVEPTGELRKLSFLRWGSPDGGPFRHETFGGAVERSATFQNLTIPTELRMGWFFGTPRFEKEGEFFRVRILSATFR